ncbi:hypothetical protein [Paenibacillus pini]|uniref:Uncharacterized protein n=1 Tax=Paenibacillus pini JCM 16418 TaxID=1236976 RepID=W7Z145_9BACL|nr:hypothetical protein [Paenibacillus pini]GAF10716.1 hypothetical protein JCM16418_4935 [Paenibacillus pini JCM 16418]
MTQEEFEKQYEEPVDLDGVHEALKRFINGRGKMSIPASPDDDDMLICRLMNELKKYREFRKPETQTIHVVQGRSGIVFSATTNYDQAAEVKDSLNEIESDRARMSYWENNKIVLQD